MRDEAIRRGTVPPHARHSRFRHPDRRGGAPHPSRSTSRMVCPASPLSVCPMPLSAKRRPGPGRHLFERFFLAAAAAHHQFGAVGRAERRCRVGPAHRHRPSRGCGRASAACIEGRRLLWGARTEWRVASRPGHGGPGRRPDLAAWSCPSATSVRRHSCVGRASVVRARWLNSLQSCAASQSGPRPSHAGAAAARLRPTWPTCGVRRSADARSRWPRRVATTS